MTSPAAQARKRAVALATSAQSRRNRLPATPAAALPVARVVLDLPLAHLDRPFDYLVPESLDESAVPGCRVKVRFAGRDLDAFLIERSDRTEHAGALTPLRRVVSAEPVLTTAVLRLARLVADRYAGTLADVLRLAIPPRHARVEAEELVAATPVDVIPAADELAAGWPEERGGPAWISRLSRGQSPRAVWEAPAGADWAARFAASAAATRAGGRASLLIVPDAADVRRLGAALTRLVGTGAHVVLTADLGPAARYRAYLAVLRGRTDIVVGTRSAMFAPVARLGLVAIWDDGDDNHAELRAPYPHAREVLALRAFQEDAAMLVAGRARTVETQLMVETGWAQELAADRDAVRASAPQIHVTGETDLDLARDQAARSARMPASVFAAVRDALELGPVLVHSPRYGYQPALACATCRRPARCGRCSGPLGRATGERTPRCRRCGQPVEEWRCPHCEGTRLRAPVVGSLRTAEEWGRSFPQTTVLASGGDRVLDEVSDRPAIVIATPGAEPVAPGGYAAGVLLDTWLTASRPDLRVAEESLRRWLNVAALVRPAGAGGRVVAVGDPALPALRALVRWDPAGFAAQELAERRSAGLSPVTRMATVSASPELLAEAVAQLALPSGADLLGPVSLDDAARGLEPAAQRRDASGPTARVVIRIPARRGAALSRALQNLQATRSARKLPPVRIHVDPIDLL